VQCVLIDIVLFLISLRTEVDIPMFIHLTKLPVIMPNKRSLIESEEKFFFLSSAGSVLAELVCELSN